jgi:tRNA pseudouridine55 synthase
VLLVDKSEGVTSHGVVAAARRATGVQRIGHVGTLDPFATGLLVLLIGRATRLAPFVEGEPKVYETTIAFGTETTTDDRTGDVVRTSPTPDADEVAKAIAQLTGSIDQEPPAYSAKKRDGVHAYEIARRGGQVSLAPVRVTVHDWTVLGRSDTTLRARIECSGGTYIRALGRDLGRLTGTSAHLAALRRIRSGCFCVADAIGADRLAHGDLPLLSPRSAIPSLATQSVRDAGLQRILHGNPIDADIPDGEDGTRVALVDDSDVLVAVAERRGRLLQPKVVLRDA